MNYRELIVKALKGRSVNSMAKEWGVNQPTLDRYVKAERMPDFDLALKIVKEAGVDPATGFEILAAQEREHRVKNFKLKQGGFVQTDLLFLCGGGVFVVIWSILCKVEDSAQPHILVLVFTTGNHPARHVD